MRFLFFFCGAATQHVSRPSHSWGFLDHTQWRTTVSRTPLDEWSACRRDLYLTTHNTYNRQTSMSLVGFKPTISADEWPQTYALDRATTGTGKWGVTICILQLCSVSLSLTLCVMYLVTLYNSRSHFEITVDPLMKWLKRWSVSNTGCPVLPHDVYVWPQRSAEQQCITA
jgi:hypothetical protein